MSIPRINIYDEFLRNCRNDAMCSIDEIIRLTVKKERQRIKDAFEKHFIDGGFISPAQLIRVLEGENYD